MTELLRPGRSFFLDGVCGAGMSSLAMLLHSIGMDVRGSDIVNDGPEAERLTSLGIKVISEAEASGALRHDEILVRSSAIRPDNVVLMAAAGIRACLLYTSPSPRDR